MPEGALDASPLQIFSLRYRFQFHDLLPDHGMPVLTIAARCSAARRLLHLFPPDILEIHPLYGIFEGRLHDHPQILIVLQIKAVIFPFIVGAQDILQPVEMIPLRKV